ncbi:MAG: class F sortase [Anaerolineales bacterium]|nr:MAG: class F sortase [Anaerolineales bacterium]
MRNYLAIVAGLCLTLLAAGAAYAASVSVYTVDGSPDDVGYYTSLAVSSSGNAVIGYFDNTNNTLKLAICNDAACSAPSIQTLAASGGQGTYTSLQLAAGDIPVIAYYTFPSEDMRLLRCADAACSSVASDIIVDSSQAGSHNSMVLNSSGNPVMSYYNAGGNGDLFLATCANPSCTASTVVAVDGGANDSGLFTSLQLDGSGFPVIAYYDADTDSVNLARCNNVTCTSRTLTVVDSSSHVGFNGISLQLDSSGNPVIAYYDVTNQRLKLAHCSNATCTAVTINVVDDAGNVGQYPSMKLDGGLPVISYYDDTNGDLKLALCQDANCAAVDIQVLDSTGNVGWDTSLQLGSVHISYYDATNGNLKLAFIPSAAAPPTSTTPATLPETGFARGRSTQLAAPAVAYAATDLRLSIPSQGVDARIVGVPAAGGDWDVSWLGSQVGYLEGTVWPTWVGNSVLTGHVWNADNTPGVFAGVRNLAYGQQIEIEADGQTYVYEVRQTRLVLPGNLGALNKDDGYAWLTLITCEGYNPFTGDYLFRRAVSAVLVNVK